MGVLRQRRRAALHAAADGQLKTGPAVRAVGVAALTLLLCTGCDTFQFKTLAKSDVSLIADAHMRQMREHQASLMVKLYRRNPRELAKVSGQTVDTRLEALRGNDSLDFEELNHVQKIDAMLLAFNDNYQGDRVFALMVGLAGMIRAAYDDRSEYFMFQSLDQQALYNSARNIEILSWRLRHRQGPDGQVYLLTTGTDAETGDLNLSFERIFGKMIALQDMMASIASDRNQRAINLVVQSVATMVFLPIP